jgi:hypothetical protein
MINTKEVRDIFEEKQILSEMIFEKTGKVVRVEFGELWALGEWFYVEKSFLGNLRLGTNFNTAKSFVKDFLTIESL